MFGAFGSLAAMNQSIKQNRDILKATKKSSSERISLRGSVKNNRDFAGATLSESDRIMIISGVFEENRKERQKQIVSLTISVCLAAALVVTFLYFW